MKLSSYPHLVNEWHPTKNGDLTPDDFTHGTHKKVWWLCSKGHTYKQLIKNKTILKYGCPECSGRKASETNNLSTQFPDVVKEWHPTLNKDFKANEFNYHFQALFSILHVAFITQSFSPFLFHFLHVLSKV